MKVLANEDYYSGVLGLVHFRAWPWAGLLVDMMSAWCSFVVFIWYIPTHLAGCSGPVEFNR